MHLHILGICGTFMGGIALLARAAGHKVTGSDADIYPPMSTQLQAAGIGILEGYEPEHLQPAPDVVVVGNAMTRGNPAVEYLLDEGLPYTSGPQWLSENVLAGQWVVAVAGTHGKTTTAAMLAWILDEGGLNPGFLVGGIPNNFDLSARAGGGGFFVVEADEYDTAFFDKRSKFVHYRPRTAILNNLEFDHADIFDDLAQIQRQFHHLVRIVPGSGLVIAPADDAALKQVLEMGLWSPLETLGPRGQWRAEALQPDGGAFRVLLEDTPLGEVHWALGGEHNMRNALAAIAAARHLGVPPAAAVETLCRFENVKRRMELRGEVDGVRVYDDFAHHPTAIRSTLEGLRHHVGKERILAVLEPRSNTMRMGIHAERLPASLAAADRSLIYAPQNLGWDARALFAEMRDEVDILPSTEAIVLWLRQNAHKGDHVLVMSNGGFENLHQRVLDVLEERNSN
ncbi:MAG: UDP-N-acetylmuramate:L-alanyl-gamma-D-glutamyl-meso-diaminopimelate ligase [Pseudomonadota bacterium]